MPSTLGVDLSFSRTVDRAMIHRHNLTEVFLTDIQQIDSENFVAAALLPVIHPHYTSHAGRIDLLDPMLLLECARQAETFAAHAFFDVEMGAAFVLRNWSMELSAQALSTPFTGPTELVMTAATSAPRTVAGRVRGLTYTFELWASNEYVGRIGMEVGYVAKEPYRAMRARGRSGPVPSSADLPHPVAATPVEPTRVGRLHTTDTLPIDLAVAADKVTAALRVPADNPSLFDHAQDHVPGMVLLEAGRQLAALAAGEWGAGAADRTAMVSMDASFTAYAELDAPVTMTATRAGDSPAEIDVTFHQGGADISRVRVGLATVREAQS
ncbi:AfsA-related hotdog domain-containing protein [Streptomyces melanogenes]|uniref:AfsA-related hotdog domain-containing protein n=1 Tax=Streptomyces melanogenes TaxID=67326 RepID=UPI00167D6DB1|nr:AfsA-related hotdog domain-containing protein [Streptomyces melanogenes]GGP94686.1 lactone biosynthesis protein [Streptomyces melanogenes]